MYEAGEQQNGRMAHPLILFMFGAVCGATVALLTAPASGSETRAQIAGKAHQLKDKAGEIKDQVVEKASEWKEKAVSSAHDTLDRVAGNNKRNPEFDSAREMVNQARETINA